jgi:maleylpyruvate isomerase
VATTCGSDCIFRGSPLTPVCKPDGFVAERLPDVAGSFAGRDDAPACLVEVTGTGQAFRIGPADAEGTARVSGPPRPVLAWLIGRGDGTGLEVDPAGPPPVLPPW